MKRRLGPMGLAGGLAKREGIQKAAQRGRRRRPGPALVVAALVAAMSMALAGPALAAEPPTVTSIEPTKEPPGGGTSVAITGTNFTGVTAVKFDENNAASYTVNSATSISAVAPDGSNTGSA